MENYKSPDFNEDSFTCPHCGTLSLMSYTCYSNRFINNKEINGFFKGKDDNITIAKCYNCSNNIIWIGDKYIYPDILAEKPNEDMPTSVKQLYNEAGLIYNKSPRAACALLRLAVDRLCNELGETDRDINKNIGALVQKGLSTTIQQALDVVRVIGNKAVHPGNIAFDVDDSNTAIQLMKLLNLIVQRMMSEPKEIKELFKNLPEDVKKSVEKRDK